MTADDLVLLSKREVAEAFRISPRTVERFVAAGRLPPPLAVGGRRLWRAATLRQWLDAGCPPGEPPAN